MSLYLDLPDSTKRDLTTVYITLHTYPELCMHVPIDIFDDIKGIKMLMKVIKEVNYLHIHKLDPILTNESIMKRIIGIDRHYMMYIPNQLIRKGNIAGDIANRLGCTVYTVEMLIAIEKTLKHMEYEPNAYLFQSNANITGFIDNKLSDMEVDTYSINCIRSIIRDREYIRSNPFNAILLECAPEFQINPEKQG